MGSIIGGQGDGAGRLEGWIAEGLNQGWFDCGRLFRSMRWAIDPYPIIRFPMTKYLFEISIRQLRKILANGKHEKRCHKDL